MLIPFFVTKYVYSKLLINAGSNFFIWHWGLRISETALMQAMEPAKKKEVMEDLDAFQNGKDYHARIGKAWKRDYLLYGPPGTGKSTMVAAMVNYLHYDVYDLELTSVHTNTDLCKLFIGTINKSIIIEDIDCSLDLTGKRKKKKKTDSTDTSNNKDGPLGPPSPKEDKSDSKVTLSGMLNFIDDLWSGSGVERIIVYVHHQPHRQAGPGSDPVEPDGQAHRATAL
jgi:hypothetical protein